MKLSRIYYFIGSESAVDLQCTEVCLQGEAQYSCAIDDTPGIILRWSVPNLNNWEGDSCFGNCYSSTTTIRSDKYIHCSIN